MGFAGTTGSALRAMREELGLSLRDLASRVDPPTSHSYIAEVERGEKTPKDRWLRDVNQALADAMAERAS